MTAKRIFSFTASIYDAVLRPDSWNTVLDEFSDIVGAAGATLQVLDPVYSINKCNAISSLYRNDPEFDKKFGYYFGELWERERAAYDYVQNHPEKGFLAEYEGLGVGPDDLEKHEPSIWMRNNFGIFFRLACRLNTTNAWRDHLSFQYRADRREAAREEIDFANLFIPHFAKAVELGRSFAVLKARFNALLSALDHYHIGTLVTLPNGILLLENSEAQRILDCRDGLMKDDAGRLGLARQDSAELFQLIHKVSATAKGEGMEPEQLLTVPRRSGLDPYVLSICPLRDPEDTLEEQFRGAIIYVMDPANLSIVSTRGIAKLYQLTSAEDAVCTLLVKGMKTDEIAEVRSVKVETVRSQIKSLLEKTRTGSRIHLIKLALSINLPIDGAASCQNDGDRDVHASSRRRGNDA